ncbi:CPBP family intramembrane glutamic endopeptidase [Kribbella speibonae]|uniref:CPBP family intramembrane metalloprotease n=1 Tax=Kribbella speibonae TaxID=1572660 RepID=A0ABY1ZZW2_9ACTN|nr:type II CAAX endopeptidase family protein [Kribbella speibonae]TCC20769.1 CPBP family intramembrane metalloprotease [Kribbella speibonae]
MFLRVLVFSLVTMVFSGILNALQAATGPSPELIQLVQFAPALGVGVMFLLFRRTTRVDARFTPPALSRSALVVGIVVAAMAVSVLVHVIAGRPWRADGLPFPFWVLVITMVIGAAGEELGWRAYLQPYLQTRFSVLRSSLVVGVLWGFWHIGGFEHGLAYMGLFVVMATALSVVMGAVLRGARRTNLVVATAAHAAVNLSLILLFTEEDGNLFPMAVLAVVWTIAAVAVSSVQVRRAVEVEDRAARPVRLG